LQAPLRCCRAMRGSCSTCAARSRGGDEPGKSAKLQGWADSDAEDQPAVQIDRLNVAVPAICNHVRMPLGEPVLVGGMTFPGREPGSPDEQLYLVVEVEAAIDRGRVARNAWLIHHETSERLGPPRSMLARAPALLEFAGLAVFPVVTRRQPPWWVNICRSGRPAWRASTPGRPQRRNRAKCPSDSQNVASA